MDKGYINGTEVHSGFTPTHIISVGSGGGVYGYRFYAAVGSVSPNNTLSDGNTFEEFYTWDGGNIYFELGLVATYVRYKIEVDNGIIHDMYIGVGGRVSNSSNTALRDYLISKVGSTIGVIITPYN